MTRPKLRIELDTTDQVWEAVAVAGLLVLILYPVFYFSNLPDEIPIHFNAAGEADGFGHKGFVWLLPIIGLVLYLSMSLITRHPHTFNYTKEITSENAESEYRRAARLIRIVKTTTVVAFAYINFSIVRTGLGEMQGLGPYFLPVFLALTFTPIGWYWWSSSKKQKADGS